MTDNWEDFRTEQGGGKGISFGGVGDRSQIGVVKGGRVLDVKPKQEVRDYKTKELKKTKGGRQLWQLPVLLETAERAHPDDDGQRILYVKGLMFDAIDEALETAGRKTLEIGGVLEIAYVGDRRVGEGEMRAFKARYTPAPPQAAQNQAGVWGGQPAPQADPFAGGQPAAPQSHPSEVFAAAGGPPAQGYPQQQPPAADPFAGGQQQGPPPGWGQQPPQHGYANGGPIQATPQQGPPPAVDPWGQAPQQPPAGGGQWPTPGPQQPAGSLQDQWAAAGQQPAPADPWS